MCTFVLRRLIGFDQPKLICKIIVEVKNESNVSPCLSAVSATRMLGSLALSLLDRAKRRKIILGIRILHWTLHRCLFPLHSLGRQGNWWRYKYRLLQLNLGGLQKRQLSARSFDVDDAVLFLVVYDGLS